MKVIAWNIRGLINKETELEKPQEEQKADFAVISETKKKRMKNKRNGRIHCCPKGVKKEERAAEGVMLYIHKRYKNQIEHYNIRYNRIILARIKSKRGYITIVGVYAPKEGRNELSNEFYSTLQKVVQRMNSKEELIIAGDLNA